MMIEVIISIPFWSDFNHTLSRELAVQTIEISIPFWSDFNRADFFFI